MPFKHAAYITQFLAKPGLNDAAPYGVSIIPAKVPQGQPYYRAIGIHHLSGWENSGKNNIFLDVLDEQGRRMGPPWPLVDWEWVGMQDREKPGLVVLDKPKEEPAGNIGLHAAQIATVWVAGRSSDKVTGLQTAGIEGIPEEPGNHRYHNSFYVVFQRTIAGAPPPIVTLPIEETPPDDWRLSLSPEELWIVNNIGLVAGLFTKMVRLLDERAR